MSGLLDLTGKMVGNATTPICCFDSSLYLNSVLTVGRTGSDFGLGLDQANMLSTRPSRLVNCSKSYNPNGQTERHTHTQQKHYLPTFAGGNKHHGCTQLKTHAYRMGKIIAKSTFSKMKIQRIPWNWKVSFSKPILDCHNRAFVASQERCWLPRDQIQITMVTE